MVSSGGGRITPLAVVRDAEFDHGKYINFLVDGSKLGKFYIRIERGQSTNANLSALFIKPAIDKGPFESQQFASVIHNTLGGTFDNSSYNITKKRYDMLHDRLLLCRFTLAEKSDDTSVALSLLAYILSEYDLFFSGLNLINGLPHQTNTDNLAIPGNMEWFIQINANTLSDIPHSIN